MTGKVNSMWRRHARLGTALLCAASAAAASALVMPAQAAPDGVRTVTPHQVSVRSLPAQASAHRPSTPTTLRRSPLGLKDNSTTVQGTAQGAALSAPTNATAPGGASGPGTGGPQGATSNVERLEEFEGIDQTCCVPPDTQFAAGPSDVIEMVNTDGLISDRAGNVESTQFGLDAFFGSTTSGTDPRVLYDPVSARFFASYELRSAGGDTVAIAASSDNTPWNWCYVYVASNTAGHVYDQPKLGFSNDKVVVSWNEYHPGFIGSVISVAQKSDLMSCVTVHVWNSALDNTRFGLQPAASVTSVSTEWLTWHNGGTQVVGAASVTGTPSAGTTAVAYNSYTFNAGTINEPPAAHQPSGGDATVETGDSRTESSMYRSGIVWTSFTGGCTPPNETMHSCAFFFRLDTANLGTANINWAYINNNFDVYFPSVATLANGDLVFGATISATTQNPSGAVYIVPGAVFTTFNGVYIQTGATPYACGCGRWGDYSATVIDPVDGNDAWATQEYGGMSGCSGCWGTAVAKVTRYTPALSSTSLSSYTANSTCSPTVTLTGSEFGRDDSVVHIAGFSVTPTWTSTDRISFSLPSANPQSTSITVSDGVGTSNALGFTYVTDTTAPTSSASVSPTPNGSGWNNTSPTVNISSTDNSCGSGMSQLQWSATGAQPSGTVTVSGGPGTISTSISITTQGVTTISYHGVDRAGNVEATKTITVRYDSTAPSASIDGAAIQLVIAGASLTGTASDNLSGISTVTVTFTSALGSVTRTASCTSGCGTTFEHWSVSTSGLAGVYTVTATARDIAGNTGLPSAPVLLVVS